MSFEDLMALDTNLPAKLVATGALLSLLIITRWAVLRWLRVSELPSAEMRRRWIVMVRNLSALLFVLFMTVIWASQLRTFALSVVAVAAAIAIATKELVSCLSGAILRTSSRSFAIGDRIEVKGLRGDVVDYNLLTTTIMEIGPAHQNTGRAITIPNALFLTDAVVNETYTEQYVYHNVVVPIAEGEDWTAAERILDEVVQETVAPYLPEAQRHFRGLAQRTGLPTTEASPKLLVRLGEGARVDLVARLPVPAERRGRIEQAILRGYLAKRRPATTTGAGA